jgi:hypothetical protein
MHIFHRPTPPPARRRPAQPVSTASLHRTIQRRLPRLTPAPLSRFPSAATHRARRPIHPTASAAAQATPTSLSAATHRARRRNHSGREMRPPPQQPSSCLEPPGPPPPRTRHHAAQQLHLRRARCRMRRRGARACGGPMRLPLTTAETEVGPGRGSGAGDPVSTHASELGGPCTARRRHIPGIIEDFM